MTTTVTSPSLAEHQHRDGHGLVPITQPVTVRERDARRRRSALSRLHRDVVLRGAAGVGGGWLAFYAAATWWTRDSGAAEQVLGELLYLVPIAVAAALSVRVAARRREPRWFWVLLAGSNVLWLAGDLTWAAYGYLLLQEPPFPSVADGFYLGSYALVPVAVLLGFRASGRLSSARGLLDAAIIATSLGFTGWVLLLQPQLGGPVDAAVVTGVAYPLLGVVIMVTLLAVAFSAHHTVPLSIGGIAVAFAVTAVTDAGYTWAVVLHDYLPGSWLNLGWQLEAVLMCLALLVALRHDDGGPSQRHRARDLTLLPVIGSVSVVLAVLLWDVQDGEVGRIAVLAALSVLVTLVLRFAVSLLDLHRTTLRLDDALREQERLAVTDGLTGLYNRRFITELLAIEVDRAHRTQHPLSVIAIDIDHFKRVNDVHGHPAGDAVLVETARRLSAALRSSDVLARSGGEEFLVVATDTEAEAVLEIAERIRRAVRDAPVFLDGSPAMGSTSAWRPPARPAERPVQMTVSLGVATLEPGDDLDDVIRRADRALYAAKDSGRDRVMNSGDMEALVALDVDPAVVAVLERVADIIDRRLSSDEHSSAVARWSAQVADALGLPAQQRVEIAMAGRLHDIGKIDIPDSVLQKRDPLDSHEWTLLRTHPAVGADMLLGLVPAAVADLVRSHHERYDGTGYPHALTGQEIPIGARIIAVTDSYAAMTVRRHYSDPKTPDEARAELVRCSGTQFDPAVVTAFLGLLAGDTILPPCPLPTASDTDSERAWVSP